MAGSLHAPVQHRRRRLARLLPLLAALAALAPASSHAAAPAAIKDPATISCPAGPAGWSNPSGPGGKRILNPLTSPQPPGHTATVSCNYFTKAGKHLLVDLLYALPSDPNPRSNFYFGCSSTGTKWNANDRIFRLASSRQWAMVSFYDLLRQIRPADVAGFERVARELLANGEGYGHACETSSTATAVRNQLQFRFSVPAGTAVGSFFTEGLASAKALPVVSVGVPAIKLNVTAKGKRHPLTVQVQKGLTYERGQRSKEQVKFSVVVQSSKVPACPVGSTGTLTVSNSPAVLLKVCSQSFLQGRANASIVALG
jgi:hypothetical protein